MNAAAKLRRARALIDSGHLTPAEQTEVDELIRTARSDLDMERQMAELNGSSHWGGGPAAGGPGDRFIASKAYKDIRSPDSRPQTFTTGPVEVSPGALGFSGKGTLLESGTSGLVTPYYEPGIVSKLFEPLAVGDLFATSTTSSATVRYAVEGTATSGAAGVAEAGAKPESSLDYSETEEPVKKIATSLAVSDEVIDDAPAIQSHLNDRLALFVRLEEERQLLRGAGTNELVGVIGRSGINTYARGTVDDNALCLLKVISNTRGSSYLEPDGIIMHPSNFPTTRALRDSASQYLGGGPFGQSYGGPAPSAAVIQDTLWGKRVVLSTEVGAGTALVGSFQQGARIWRRGGVSIEASNSHSDFFTNNLVALRAEERLALGVFRPSSFTVVSGLA